MILQHLPKILLFISFVTLLTLLPVIAAITSDDGTFFSPSARLRPRFQYWLPDASVDIATFQDNIKSAGSIGADGIELKSFYNYGAQMGGIPPDADWSTYGFGTDAFHEDFLAALRAYQKSGLIFDFAMGPNQGQGVPAKYNNEGLQWDLVSGVTFAALLSLANGFGQSRSSRIRLKSLKMDRFTGVLLVGRLGILWH